MTSEATPIDLSAFCIHCYEETVVSALCRRGEFHDHGADHDPELARYEGFCLRCCGHNHG